MLAMPRAPLADQPSSWEDESAEQQEIAAQIDNDAPVKSTPQIAGTAAPEETTVDEVVEEQPLVTLRPAADADIEFPLTLSVVGAVTDERPDGIVFDGPDSTVEVTPQVAEQVTYLDNVEVAA